jgi:hypothetical protein
LIQSRLRMPPDLRYVWILESSVQVSSTIPYIGDDSAVKFWN